MPHYAPYEWRTPDSQYAEALFRSLQSGHFAGATRQGIGAYTAMQTTMDYRVANGAPVTTYRAIPFWDRAIGELCAFINGATTLKELEEFGCNWWGPWVSEKLTHKLGIQPGSIGSASYGAAFAKFPTLDGEPFDQFPNLVAQMLKIPDDRVHFITPWMAKENSRAEDGLQKTTIAPCHGWVHARVLDNGDQKEIHLHLFQRSGDMPVGVPSNMVQYFALGVMLEHLTGYRFVHFYHTISDAHIYADQVPNVLEMFTREPRRLPTLCLNAEGLKVKDIKAFRRGHFELTDYHPHPAIKGIPVRT